MLLICAWHFAGEETTAPETSETIPSTEGGSEPSASDTTVPGKLSDGFCKYIT